jgi:hypothetical protein
MSDQVEHEWPVGSPAWHEQQTATLEAIAEIPPIFEDLEPAEEDLVEEEEVLTEDPGAEAASTSGAERNYTWVEGDQLPLVAKRLGVSRKELLDHNGISDPEDIKPGDSLHLPFARELPKDRTISIEMLPEPLPMHVAKEGGCKKWSFGNMKKWEDATSAGFYPQYTNLTVLAVAHVPIDEDEIEAAYYMDALALGDYVETGRAAWMIGYMWPDLAEGHVEKIIKTPAPVAETAIAQQEAKDLAKKSMKVAAADPQVHDLYGFDRTFVERRLADTLHDGNSMKFVETYQSLQPVGCIASFPDGVGLVDEATGKRYIWIHDFATKRPDRKLTHLQDVIVAGTFEYDGILYGRPLQAAKNFNWYGVPMDMLLSHDELYNVKPDVQSRAATGTLTWSERNIWVPLSKLVNHPFLVRRRQLKNKNK